MPITLNYNGTRITDAIAGILTTSLANYNAADTNDLIPITAAEYAALQTGLSLTRTQASDTTFGNVVSAISYAGSWAVQQTAWQNTGFGTPFMAGYAVAMKVKSLVGTGGITSVGTGWQLGYATSNANGSTGVAISNISTLNQTIPLVNSGSHAFHHFVIKAPNVLIPANANARYRNGPTTQSIAHSSGYSTTDSLYKASNTNVTEVFTSVGGWNFGYGVQVLQTANKQW